MTGNLIPLACVREAASAARFNAFRPLRGYFANANSRSSLLVGRDLSTVVGCLFAGRQASVIDQAATLAASPISGVEERTLRGIRKG